MDLPKISQEPIVSVDATPNKEYPLRILEAYRENCNCRWESDSPDLVLDMMNHHSEERAKILDEAIRVLKIALQPKNSADNQC